MEKRAFIRNTHGLDQEAYDGGPVLGLKMAFPGQIAATLYLRPEQEDEPGYTRSNERGPADRESTESGG